MDEARLEAIERRLARLERLLRVEEPPAPVSAPPAAPMHPPAVPPPPRETVSATEVSLEELFGAASSLGSGARPSSSVVGGIGILGALLAPVLVDAGTSSASLAFMAVALVAAVAVLVWQRWPWLAFGSFVVGVPQLLDWMVEERHRLVLALAVLALFWALYVVAALAHEVRVPTPTLRVSSAMLLFADVVL